MDAADLFNFECVGVDFIGIGCRVSGVKNVINEIRDGLRAKFTNNMG